MATPNKVVSLKMPALPSADCQDRIELADQISRSRQAHEAYAMRVDELGGMFQRAVDDARKALAEQLKEIYSADGGES